MAVVFLVVYFTIDFVVWRKKQKVTFYADIIAPIVVFILAAIYPLIEPAAFVLPLIVVMVFVPILLLLILIKSVIVLRKNKKR